MLTVMALLCRALGFYPLWLLLLSLCPADAMLPAMGILLGTAFVTGVCARLLRQRLYARKRLSFWLSGLWTVLSAAICAGGVMLLTHSPVISTVTAAVTVIGTHRKADADPADLFTVNGDVAFLTCAVIATVMLAAAYQDTHLTMTLGVIGTVEALYLLLRNQLMLHRFVNRRSSTETAVPAEIRRGNLTLVIGLIVLLAVIFVFHTPLVHFLEWLHQSLIRLVYAVGRFLYHIAERLSGAAPEEAEEILIGEEAELPQTAGKSNPLWMLLWIPFIAVAWVIWREFLSDWVYDIKMFLIDLAARLRKSDPDAQVIRRTAAGEYYDTETTLRRTENERSRKRAWRRELRRWHARPDGSEKFYAGYRLLLEAPCWESGMLRQSDTVREIRDKWAEYFTPDSALDAVTSDFHADRYAEQGLPEEAIRDLAAALERIRTVKTEKQR